MPHITSQNITEARPPKVVMDPFRPHFFLNEQEVQSDGQLHSVNTIFLTNKECSFKCVMCDLWRHTLNEPTPAGAIPKQIEFALEHLPQADVVKLYNSGNFFDGKAIPKTDYKDIADLLSGYEHVVVENHPKLIGPFILEFRDLLNGTLEIAMGLETIHPDVLPRLNKQITTENFQAAAEFLTSENITSRAFILLNPPFLTNPLENIEWCLKSVEFAFDTGVSTCSVIPTRDGNGIMEQLRESGDYVPPKLSALEEVFDRALQLNKGRVFCDIWDLEKFSDCENCFTERKNRLHRMNLEQVVLPEINCGCNLPSRGVRL
ncbi:MAG: hypothetical protein WD604_16970 [Balneolaceae bacterium]